MVRVMFPSIASRQLFSSAFPAEGRLPMSATGHISSVIALTLVTSPLMILAATYRVKGTGAPIHALGSQEEKKEERVLEDEIPKHVPLRAKIRKEKEKEFKDLKNENWAHDFELEVTNVGDRQIYYFDLILITDVKAVAGFRIVAPVAYGRSELDTPGAKAIPDDVPLKPGESTIIKIHPGQLKAWDHVWRKENRPFPRKVRVVFQGLNFGD